jgi:hypothetical protein
MFYKKVILYPSANPRKKERTERGLVRSSVSLEHHLKRAVVVKVLLALGPLLRCIKFSWDAVYDENGHVAATFASLGGRRGAESCGALSLAFVPVPVLAHENRNVGGKGGKI